jgi:hypothetical protein
MWYHIVMKIKALMIPFAASAFAGCITFSETQFPVAAPAPIDANRTLSVQLSGFEATVTTYVPIYGWETVHDSTPCRRHRHHTHTYETIAVETYIPQVENTLAYIRRATDTFEKCGFTLQSATPQYRVDVAFSGPFVSNGESVESLAWALLSLLTADYGVQTWSARMKIYDLSTGKVCLYKEYSQKYESYIWGPIPIFSPAWSGKNSYNAMQSWCLTALTDRATADATQFLAVQPAVSR